jgi:hypothetical protein
MSFLDGFSFAGLLGGLRIPGSPVRIFATPEAEPKGAVVSPIYKQAGHADETVEHKIHL